MKKFMLIILIAATAIIVIGKLTRKDDPVTHTDRTERVNKDQSDSVAAVEVSQEPEEEPSNWKYREKEDKINSTTTYYATVSANETMEFDFPYNGGTVAYIVVRKNASGNDVMLKISQGQFVTSYTRDKYVTVKFGNNKPVKYTISRASDGSTEVVFINKVSSFISNLKANKTVVIEAEFYQEGLRQMEFNIQNFKWDH